MSQGGRAGARIGLMLIAIMLGTTRSGLAAPQLGGIFPLGGKRGTTVEVTISGNQLDDVDTLYVESAHLSVRKLEPKRFAVTISESAPVGQFFIRAASPAGLSAPRPFHVSARQELLEAATNADSMQRLPIGVTVNGRLQEKGEVDRFEFEAQHGERIVLECWADRIHSPLRAVLELYDPRGKRIQVSRGFFGLDPVIVLDATETGIYSVKLYDLTYTGGASHVYRLDVDAQPRIAFSVPQVVRRGQTQTVRMYGWNLGKDIAPIAAKPTGTSGIVESGAGRRFYEFVDVEVAVPKDVSPSRRTDGRSFQSGIDVWDYQHPGASAPHAMGLTDVSVIAVPPEHHSPATALPIDAPCELSGQLVRGGSQDWFVLTARRGEVLWIEGIAHQLGLSVDLDVSILDGDKEVANWSDQLQNFGGTRYPTDNLDPAGRWVAPHDGDYHIVVRNVTGGFAADERHCYVLSVRREEPDARVVAVPTSSAANVPLGGNVHMELLAFRRRGGDRAIRVSAEDLPVGVSCPPVWLGPGVDRAPLVIHSADHTPAYRGPIKLVATMESFGDKSRVLGGTPASTGRTLGDGRILPEVTFQVAPRVAARLVGRATESRIPQGSLLQIEVQIVRDDVSHLGAVQLEAWGHPREMQAPLATIAEGSQQGYLCVPVPANMAPGHYSLAVQGTTTIPGGDGKPTGITLTSNVVNFEVYKAPFLLLVDPRSPKKIRRGQVITVNYFARRQNGFIGKIHTEVRAPRPVDGLRVRGVTFVGQTERGTLQIIASDGAPLGQQPFLYLEAIGTVEDEPVHLARCFLNLEVIEGE